jgi:intein/homing endonuclease
MIIGKLFVPYGEFKPIEKIIKENIPTLKNQDLTSFDISKIKSVEYIDCSKVYDIEVEQNHNYYLENNILVHNSKNASHNIKTDFTLIFTRI